MFIVIQNDTLNLNDISRISRHDAIINVYFISKPDPVSYIFKNEGDATEVEYKVFQGLEQHGLVV